MARLARIVVPGLPHHVTQRGNGRAKVFFGPRDYELYRDLLVEHCRAADVGIWAWCLMPNHVHLILTPTDPDGLRRALAKVHRVYAGTIHARQKKTGHFWQGRFGAVAMDEDHLLAALRYVGLNPVRAKLVEQAADWPWSSARAHLTGKADGVTDLKPIQDRLPSPVGLFDPVETDVAAFDALRKAESIGRPVGREAFLDRVAGQIGKAVKPQKRGRTAKEK
ncbi:transposase [Mesorhizobium sp. M2C.T.Ca.TU.002.02.1.1]|uniref:transposase n=1 Tax=Mesorhizobium sp. M2C.T.Ca.TU.002.02.1.1 TaxID=2496788 RepID=UPI000FC99F52|nr:transposase [Mesorhizobium sp. M2C.T.Ca.TU.002.02.1.1]RUU59786.1 transposase [Mesorhizobium sp. M2C.T.Ca.TU.002.02.1.1]RUU70025.1 transposase [Mesorhizobium sp. M2C.T.Ca.TU.009.01.2.1]